MEDRRFDSLAKTLVAGGGSRRRVLRTVGTGALVILLGRLGLGKVAAACGRPVQKCDDGKRCCKGASCRGGKCRCRSGVACAGRCCKRDQLCAGGKCVTGIGTCLVGADACALGSAFPCNGGNSGCNCLRTLAGATRCGQAAADCGTCSKDADCEGLLGTGAFCFRRTGSDLCNCPAGQEGTCAIPCPV